MLPLKDTHAPSVFPFWIITIIALNVYVFYLELTSPNPDAFILSYALIPSLVSFSDLGSLTPFLTSQFLHGGFLHIISNMWFLWVFGGNVEEKLGLLFFPIFYIIAGTLGNIIQYLIVPTADIPMLGASGAIAGVLGAYYVLFPKHTIKTLVFIIIFVTVIDMPAWIMLFFWFVTQLFSGAATIATPIPGGGIAWFAHISGFVFGILAGKYLAKD